MSFRPAYSLDQIKNMLLDRLDQVVAQYAPPAKGSHTTFGKYFTLNPGRADRSVGSFYVHMSGARAGKWMDHATGDYGDVLDLIGLSLGLAAPRDILTEARAFLGLDTLGPDERRRREEAAARGKRLRAEAAAREQAERGRKRKRALAFWLSGRESLRGTPAEAYLRDRRGVDLGLIGRQPGSLRYVPVARYYFEDDDTGEVFERDLPALAALVTNRRGQPIACHRHYLALGRDGLWQLAHKREVADPVPKGKLVLGYYGGGWITISNGIGPRGGKGISLMRADPGQHVYITEGVEDALSVMVLLPDARVIAAISLSNIGAVDLPATVSTVTLVADQDEHPDARAALERAIAQHQSAGREVRLWQNLHGGKDMNDALLAARDTHKNEGAA